MMNVEINKDVKLSQHFTLGELCKTSVKTKDGNIPRIEQAIRYACILLDISDESQEEFDELLIEQKKNSLWVHFAVRPEGNRRKVMFIT